MTDALRSALALRAILSGALVGLDDLVEALGARGAPVSGPAGPEEPERGGSDGPCAHAHLEDASAMGVRRSFCADCRAVLDVSLAGEG